MTHLDAILISSAIVCVMAIVALARRADRAMDERDDRYAWQLICAALAFTILLISIFVAAMILKPSS